MGGGGGPPDLFSLLFNASMTDSLVPPTEYLVPLSYEVAADNTTVTVTYQPPVEGLVRIDIYNELLSRTAYGASIFATAWEKGAAGSRRSCLVAP